MGNSLPSDLTRKTVQYDLQRPQRGFTNLRSQTETSCYLRELQRALPDRDPVETLGTDLRFARWLSISTTRSEGMSELRIGDRVRIGEAGTGRVIAIVNGWLYRVRHDEPDLFGNTTGDYLSHVLRRASANTKNGGVSGRATPVHKNGGAEVIGDVHP
jgi:hypothetical protein